MKNNLKAKKSLGQNFLRSRAFLELIVKSGEIKEGELVLEIGPGDGAMTEELLKKGARVVAIEKDKELISLLNEKFNNKITSGDFKLIEGDVLSNDELESLLKDTPFKIIANIPYYITGQIIRKFLEATNKPSSITLLVQKEVAERIVAKDKKESILSLSVKVFGEPVYIKTVPRGAFQPQPNVDSAIIKISNISKNKLEGIKESMFFTLLHLGFGHKRKQLLSNLSAKYDKKIIQDIFLELNIDNKVRSEDLNIETWIKLCNIISKTWNS